MRFLDHGQAGSCRFQPAGANPIGRLGINDGRIPTNNMAPKREQSGMPTAAHHHISEALSGEYKANMLFLVLQCCERAKSP